MAKYQRKFSSILFVSVLMTAFSTMPVLAASISGTVFKDGSNPVNDATIAVNLYSGEPCGRLQLVNQDTTTDGNYTIAGISPGIYYLKTVKVSGTPNYIDEWWASGGSIWDCWGGEAIIISSSEDVISNKNFQLDLYGSISGSLYDATGALVTATLDVSAFRGTSCENAQWINVSTLAQNPNYTISNVPPGTYYVRSHNKGDSWYVDEFHTVSGNVDNGVSYQCASATQVMVNSGMDTTDIDFQLDSGGRISGTVFQSDGATPITDAEIRIESREDTACDGNSVGGTLTSNGHYIIAGLPIGSYYIRAFRDSGANYSSEWYSIPLSSYNCDNAVSVQVWVGQETQNRDFQLDSGGSITGTLVDENEQPLGNLKVEYDSQNSGKSQETWSDPVDGTFTLYGLNVGHAEITIISDPTRYLAGFRRNLYLEMGEDKDMGTLKVLKGSTVRGTVAMDGTPLADFELYVGAKLGMAELDTAPDGTFDFVLPPGEFVLNNQEDFFATAPRKIVVKQSDIMTERMLPTVAAYDTSNGDVYSGNITINNSPPAGSEILLLSFMDDMEFDINKWETVQPMSVGGFFDGSATTNPWQLATPPGSTVQLMLGEWNDNNNSFTRMEVIHDAGTGGTYNFTYSNTGSTVDGHVTRDGQPVFWATVVLYREPGNEFIGFGRTDHNGHYIINNVPDAVYHLDATAEDYACVDKTPSFSVSGNLTLPEIELGNHQGDFEPDDDVDGLDLNIFSTAYAMGNLAADLDRSGVINADDLAVFAVRFGRSGCSILP